MSEESLVVGPLLEPRWRGIGGDSCFLRILRSHVEVGERFVIPSANVIPSAVRDLLLLSKSRPLASLRTTLARADIAPAASFRQPPAAAPRRRSSASA